MTDEQIAAMSADERGELIRRLSRPVDEIVPSRRWLRLGRDLWVTLMVGSAVVLVPWIAYLAVSLPRAYVAHNWDRVWVGFDVLLLAMLLLTAVLGLRRRPLVVVTGFATGLLLICDAWFDVMTADADDIALSLATALLVELPLAALLVTGSLQRLRTLVGKDAHHP